jgi:hypothetical protein
MKKEDHCIACKTVLINEICPNCAAKRGPLRGCVITYSTDSPFAPPFDEAKERAELKALIRKCREEDEAKARAKAVVTECVVIVTHELPTRKEARIEQSEKGAKPQSRAPIASKGTSTESVKSQVQSLPKVASSSVKNPKATASKGKGRPRKGFDVDKAQALLDIGKPLAAVAAQLSVSISTLRRALESASKVPEAVKNPRTKAKPRGRV